MLALTRHRHVVICLKIRTFVVSATTISTLLLIYLVLWFAWKFVPLWYQQQPSTLPSLDGICCDLLENSYLCGISNNLFCVINHLFHVVICLKIRTFVVSATTLRYIQFHIRRLWFAWKFVPLWYQQQRTQRQWRNKCVVICLKIRTFVVSATTFLQFTLMPYSCDLLENSYLCGISNNRSVQKRNIFHVVICLKIRTFVVSATT